MKKMPIFAFSIFIFIQITCFWITDVDGTEKLDMRLQLEVGQKYKMQSIRELNRTVTMEGKQEDEVFMFDRGIGFEVKKVDADGDASVEVTFEMLKVKVVRAGGVNIEYDSTKHNIADCYSGAPVELVACLGESFVIKISPKGEITEVKGLEEMYSRLIDKVNEWDRKYLKFNNGVHCGSKKTSESDKTENSPVAIGWEEMCEKRPDFKKMWREMRSSNIRTEYSEEEIRRILNDMIMVLPERPLAIGDSWTDKVKIWEGSQEIDGTYTVKAVDKEIVAVDLSVKRTGEEEPFSWVNDEGREISFKITGFCEGSFEIDRATCRLLRSKVKSQLTAESLGEEADDETGQPMPEEVVITVMPME